MVHRVIESIAAEMNRDSYLFPVSGNCPHLSILLYLSV